MIRRSQVREDARGRHRGLIYAIRDGWTVSGVDQQRQVGVHEVVVERAAAARLGRAVLEHRPLDLQVTVLGERFGDVHDQEIVEQKVGQRMAAVCPQRPVVVPVEAIVEGEIGIQPGAIRTEVFLP
jgi:hypothetical protein